MARKTMRAISPVLVTVIIVAVAIAIAIAVVGWIMGLWGAITGGQEKLEIYPTTKIIVDPTTGSAALALFLRNTGDADAKIITIMTPEEEITSFTQYSTGTNPGETKVVSGNCLVTHDNAILVPSGEKCQIGIVLGGTYDPGIEYTVKLITEKQMPYPFKAVAEAGNVTDAFGG